MDYSEFRALRQHHPAWRLLAADHAPFIIAFLYDAFTKPNRRTLAESELRRRLDDHIYSIRSGLEEGSFPKQASAYLSDWSNDGQGWLRKFYPADGDEPHFDLTPAAEKAIDWLQGLERKRFIGTESRLKTVFDLLQQMARGIETDPAVRISELIQRKAEIDAEIARLHAGQIDLMDTTQIKERFYQVEQTARALLVDFRQVEQNFRDLDRVVRERIALWDGSKGELLESIFGSHDVIADSDQGRSFRAFWDFLMSPVRQEELSHLFARILSLAPVAELSPDQRLRRIHYDWMEAGDAAQRTVARLSEQLRKYLDDQAWLENRRIMTILRDIEHHALALKAAMPEGDFTELADTQPVVTLVMDRPLFAPPRKPCILQQVVEEGRDPVKADALFDQIYVDKAELSRRIHRMLQTRQQVALAHLLDEFPLERGLAELVCYLALAADDSKAMIDDTRMQTVTWTDDRGRTLEAHMPTVIFSR
ncbi:MAG: DUF3375 domain-containing protein [Gammaproteobacteria bacterium]|nr:DUF3375 domain-containing protein [Gammaproteobacteria bacterium]